VRPPASWSRFAVRHPEVAAAYDALREACNRAGDLDDRTMALVKLAVSVGHGASRTVHAHAKKALRLGVPADDLRHVVLAALPTLGLAATLDALAWVDESVLEEEQRALAPRSPEGLRHCKPAKLRP
jgi:alkylhydroperoxidase/carboxymuconolactone decarboxylase family protein YurZ